MFYHFLGLKMHLKHIVYLSLVLHVSYTMVMSRSLTGRGMDTDESGGNGEQRFQQGLPRQLSEVTFQAKTGNAVKSEGPKSICIVPELGPDIELVPNPGPGPGPGPYKQQAPPRIA